MSKKFCGLFRFFEVIFIYSLFYFLSIRFYKWSKCIIVRSISITIEFLCKYICFTYIKEYIISDLYIFFLYKFYLHNIIIVKRFRRILNKNSSYDATLKIVWQVYRKIRRDPNIEANLNIKHFYYSWYIKQSIFIFFG